MPKIKATKWEVAPKVIICNIDKARELQGLQKQQLANAVGISLATYSKYIKGKTCQHLTLELILKFMQVLNMTFEDLLQGVKI